MGTIRIMLISSTRVMEQLDSMARVNVCLCFDCILLYFVPLNSLFMLYQNIIQRFAEKQNTMYIMQGKLTAIAYTLRTY